MTTLKELEKFSSNLKNTSLMPTLFLGHGSPMNGIEDNEFVREFKKLGQQLDKPNAIIVVSAHWETIGTKVTAMENPPTIHDFGGFPKELYEVQYPAPGNPKLAKDISQMLHPNYEVTLDHRWGLDHGSWTVVKHIFPNADVPIIQLSLNKSYTPKDHYQLAQQLQKLRSKGVLIVGSGNMVHNLRQVAWDKISENYGYDWALEAKNKMNQWILDGNFEQLINYRSQGKAFDLAIPTPEHFLPLLYTLGLRNEKDEVSLFNDVPLAGSLSMTSVKLSNA